MGDTGSNYILHGLKLSYFTGKLEAYFRTKGIPHDYVEMDTADFRRCAKATGIAQMPQVETPDGKWLTDTTAIIAKFEAEMPGPNLQPSDPVAAFCSLLLEDLFDEWYWRPALYYRWAFDEDMMLMSSQIANTLMRDLRLPFFLRRQFILKRQRKVFLKQDGVTKETAPVIEALYLDTLKTLDTIFSKRPFLMGQRPCEADFGLFGPFFRHFFSDPTPGSLMRETAPNVANWVTRLWATRPSDLEGAPEIQSVPDDLGFFFEIASADYLPYLQANAHAVDGGQKQVRHRAQGVDWSVPAAPYRVFCLSELRRHFQQLGSEEKAQVGKLIGKGVSLLEGDLSDVGNPASHTDRQRPTDRLWKNAG